MTNPVTANNPVAASDAASGVSEPNSGVPGGAAFSAQPGGSDSAPHTQPLPRPDAVRVSASSQGYSIIPTGPTTELILKQFDRILRDAAKDMTTRFVERKSLQDQAEAQYYKAKAQELEKAAEASKKRGGLFGKIFGWIAKVLTTVAAVVVAVATAGAAGFVLGAVALYMVADTVTSAIADITGNPNIRAGKFFEAIVYVGARAIGKSNEQARDVAKKAGGWLEMAVITSLSLIGGGLLLYAVKPLSRMAQKAVQISIWMGMFGGLMQAGVDINNGVLEISKAKLDKDVAKLKKEATQYDAYLKQQEYFSKSLREWSQQTIESLNNNQRMIADYKKDMVNIAVNARY